MPLLRDVPNEQKREMGQAINSLKNVVENAINDKKAELEEKEIQNKINSAEKYDISLPVRKCEGSIHPRTIIQKKIEDVFVSMGFAIEDGNEVETEFNNFDAVNVPKNHPARDMQDTFWLNNGQLLKTQTSAAQNRILKTYGPVCKVIFPGRVFRNEALDARHENTFFQLEGVVVGKNITVANLIYFEKAMLKALFKKDIEVRLRPGFFPFTEPSYEMDAKCPFCGGKGCHTCGGSGWIELCPCGMIHPNVLKMAGIDPDEYNGFAFGLGFDRLVMLLTKNNNLREVIAFPKAASAKCPMSGAPTEVTADQLAELGIKVKE
jgi:phenylalanyl-tRNA synthetase alpha chain